MNTRAKLSVLPLAHKGSEGKVVGGKKSSSTKYTAHLPCQRLPDELYFYSTGTEVDKVVVTTDDKTKSKIYPLAHNEIPSALPEDMSRFYLAAVEYARQGTTVVHVMQDCDMHKQILYAAPVLNKATKAVAGVIVALDLAPLVCCPTVKDFVQEQAVSGVSGWTTVLPSPPPPARASVV